MTSIRPLVKAAAHAALMTALFLAAGCGRAQSEKSAVPCADDAECESGRACFYGACMSAQDAENAAENLAYFAPRLFITLKTKSQNDLYDDVLSIIEYARAFGFEFPADSYYVYNAYLLAVWNDFSTLADNEDFSGCEYAGISGCKPGYMLGAGETAAFVASCEIKTNCGGAESSLKINSLIWTGQRFALFRLLRSDFVSEPK